MDYKEVVEAINSVARISDLLEEYGTRLHTPKHEEQIHCPFHGADRSPSARHYPDTNSIHCFTCKKSWDPVRFMMEKKGVRFTEALDLLGHRYGVSTENITYNQDGSKTRRFTAASSTAAHKGLTEEDKMLLAKGGLESRILSCRGKTELGKYLNMVYLMAVMWDMEDSGNFLQLASKVMAATKRVNERDNEYGER